MLDRQAVSLFNCSVHPLSHEYCKEGKYTIHQMNSHFSLLFGLLVKYIRKVLKAFLDSDGFATAWTETDG